MRNLLAVLFTLLALPAAAAELKLATWNVAWLTLRSAGDPALPRDLLPRAPEDFDRLAAYARRLDADVIALQEVDGPEAVLRVLDGREYALFFPDEADVQRTAFAVRRTVRVVQNPDLTGLDLFPGARHSLRRGVDVTVQAGGRPLRLLSIHLKGGCRDARLLPPAGPDCDALSRQAPVLAGWVAERRREGVAFAVLGDFNRRLDRPGDDLLGTLQEAAPLLRTTEGVSNPCWSDARGGRPFIDHILLGGPARDWWVRDSLRVLVYAEREPGMRDRLSDHCPVSLRLQVR